MESLYVILGKPFGLIMRAFLGMGITNYALLIVIVTLIARLIMIPSSIGQQKGMAKTQRMQAKIRKIQEKYAGDQRKIQEETQALYQREGYNPMNAGCAPLLVQFIVLFGLIGVIWYPLTNFLNIQENYREILIEAAKFLKYQAPLKQERFFELVVIEHIADIQANKAAIIASGIKLDTIPQVVFDKIAKVDFTAFGIPLGVVPKEVKLGEQYSIVWAIPVISTITTLGSSLYSTIKQKKSGGAAGQAAASMGCMTVGMAAMSLYFVVSYPAGIGVYWIVSGLLGLASTIIIGQLYSPKKVLARVMVDETIERRSRENNIKLVHNKEDK